MVQKTTHRKPLKKQNSDLPREELNAVFSSMAEGLVVVDNQNKVKVINQMGGILLRTAPIQAEGLDIALLFNLYKVQNGEKTTWPIKNILPKMDFTRVNIWDNIYCKNKEGSLFPITFIITPLLLDADVNGAVILFRDATEEVRADKTKSDFIAISSHQLQTPLTAMKLFSEMISSNQDNNLTEKQKEYFHFIRIAVERMIRLVNEMLNISRIEAGMIDIHPEPTDLVEFIGTKVEELKIIGRQKKCNIIFNKPTKTFKSISVDTGLLSEVVSNLISNAMRYSPLEQCSVIISLQDDLEKNGYIVSVKDDGIGIAPEDQKHIFTKFFRADNARKAKSDGSGLGLYLVRMLVEVWGGEVWFKSVLRKGTTFYISIPKNGMIGKKGTKHLAD